MQFPHQLDRMVLLMPPAGHLVDVASDVGERIARRRGEPAFDAAVAAWESDPDDVTDAGFAAPIALRDAVDPFLRS